MGGGGGAIDGGGGGGAIGSRGGEMAIASATSGRPSLLSPSAAAAIAIAAVAASARLGGSGAIGGIASSSVGPSAARATGVEPGVEAPTSLRLVVVCCRAIAPPSR